jgi:hypothetical protein
MSAVLKIQETNGALPVSAAELVRNPSMMEQFNALASVMAGSKVTVPKHLQGSTGDCFAIVLQAAQWGMSPFSVAQKTHLVNGVLGYEAQLVNAVIQTSGAITGRFHYEYTGEGETLACRVGAIIRGESELVWSEWLTARSVSTKNSPLWKTNPKQQMGYLQVKNWARLYCPGAILGVYSEDELPEQQEKVINHIATQEEYKKPELAFCSDENFAQKCEQWHDLIQSGKRTADQIITMVESKYLFTAEQKEEIQSWEVVIVEGELV